MVSSMARSRPATRMPKPPRPPPSLRRSPLGTFMAQPLTQNVTACTTCTAGSFCGDTGLVAPSGPISAGFFSLGGSPTATPGFAGTVPYGGICPAGFFCGPGTITPTPCAIGTYLNTTGAVSAANCTPCPPSVYCANASLTTPAGTGPCAAGWFCSGGSSTPTQTICPAAMYCPQGSAAPIGCAPGTYNNQTGQAFCATCPAGRICGANSTYPADCPAGFVCFAGTGSLAAASKCPSGTFSATPRLSLLSQCSPCTSTMYCDVPGLTAPAGTCFAGFICSGSNTNPYGGLAGPPAIATTPCTAGGWCGAASAAATPCANGTYSSATGLADPSSCTLCDDAAYCSGLGLVAPTGVCAAGYWCGRGNAAPAPLGGTSVVTIASGSQNVSFAVGGDVCPAGSVCVAGSSRPSPCPSGTYEPSTGQGVACATCPPGFWCDVGSTAFASSVCAPGHFCPPGTAFATQFACPPGAFSSAAGLQSASQCTPCPAGAYCAGYASLSPSGACSPGYVCYGNATHPTPTDNATGVRCIAGEFCPGGATAVALCAPGQYCTDPLTGVASGPCAGGFFCTAGSWTATPGGELSVYGTPIGDVCPKGRYCPSGTVIPLACGNGTYSNHTGSAAASDCTNCLAGWQCDTPGLVLPVKPCAARYFCPTGTITVRRLRWED